MTKDLLAANRYAQALFEISRLMHCDDEIEAELDSFSAALKSSSELRDFFSNPHLRTDEKRKFLMKIYQEREKDYYEILVNFFTVLFEKNRFVLIHDIAVSFKRISDEAKGQAVADLRSAVPLAPKTEQEISDQIEKLAGYKIVVRKEIDPSLVGGVFVRVRNRVIDGTIKNRIENLKRELLKTN